jgi:hypothetical protein
MCGQCDQLQQQITHYRGFLRQRFDELTEVRIKTFIANLERQKETMHMTPSDQWTELVRCPHCGVSGTARLSKPEKRPFDFSVEAIPAGFKVIRLEIGDTFFCDACNRPADYAPSSVPRVA